MRVEGPLHVLRALRLCLFQKNIKVDSEIPILIYCNLDTTHSLLSPSEIPHHRCLI